MPISNNTDERVGVEVSGPTRFRAELATAFTTGLGTGAAIAGLVLDSYVVTIVGVLIAAVSLALFLLIRSGFIFRHMLEPNGKLTGFDRFDDMTVSFYQVTDSRAFHDQIARVDFTTRLITYPMREPEPIKVATLVAVDALTITLLGSPVSDYRVMVTGVS